MTASVPPQTAVSPEDPGPPEDRRRVVRRRALTLLIIVLLIGVPAGYLVISAAQSRASGKDKEQKYSARGLTIDWPAKVQRRVYDVPIPHPSNQVAYYETNNWRTSRLYVQFQTTHDGLDTFLRDIGVSRDQLKKDDITISDRDRNIVGWKFSGPGARLGGYWGLSNKEKNPKPSQDIVVNTQNPRYPMVYVVSRTVP
ncbi:sugar kinase [Streptomyces sp. B93]|uniref:sugar kinase n=1 Tax=Streptomyces sp. B93 TaxID=2824875 RepID=UPI001B38E0DE|nr:sugar kinase [Streptomyces sp. B93]MBQ1093264.1 sugar kinase [Streptomyces sp. B93]